MNDRFKYRAYHKPTKRLFEVWDFTPEYVFEDDEVNGVGVTPTNPARMEDCILLQSTGLRDKNGQLIFEGDIINAYVEYINSVTECKNALIMYSDSNASLDICTADGDSHEFSLFEPSEEGIEVVGNIFEQPESVAESLKRWWDQQYKEEK